MKAPIHDEPRLVSAMERRVRTWVHRNEIADHAVSSSRTRIFIAISRQAGAGGSEVAELVGQELGWQVFDKDLLDLVAERFHESRLMLDLVDETQHNWVFDVLLTWMDHQVVPHQKFVVQLRRVVLALAAECDHAVFVGRCAQFLLPRKEVLAVRVVAPQRFRAERVMQRRGIAEPAAKWFVRKRDADRRDFARQFFHQDIDDPSLYDLVVNTQAAGLTGACRQIVACALLKAGPAS